MHDNDACSGYLKWIVALSNCCTAPEHVVGLLEDHQPSVFEDDVGGECIYDIVHDMEWYTTSYYSIIITCVY